MRHFLALLLVATAPAQADTAHCAALHARAPEQIAGLPLTELASYETEHPGLGFGAQYEGPTGRLSIFYYDAGLARVEAAHVEMNFRHAMGDLSSVLRSQGLTLGGMVHYTITDPTYFVQHLGLVEDSSGRMQYVALGQHGNCMIKLRLTAPVGPDPLGLFETLARPIATTLP